MASFKIIHALVHETFHLFVTFLGHGDSITPRRIGVAHTRHPHAMSAMVAGELYEVDNGESGEWGEQFVFGGLVDFYTADTEPLKSFGVCVRSIVSYGLANSSAGSDALDRPRVRHRSTSKPQLCEAIDLRPTQRYGPPSALLYGPYCTNCPAIKQHQTDSLWSWRSYNNFN